MPVVMPTAHTTNTGLPVWSSPPHCASLAGCTPFWTETSGLRLPMSTLHVPAANDHIVVVQANQPTVFSSLPPDRSPAAFALDAQECTVPLRAELNKVRMYGYADGKTPPHDHTHSHTHTCKGSFHLTDEGLLSQRTSSSALPIVQRNTPQHNTTQYARQQPSTQHTNRQHATHTQLSTITTHNTTQHITT